MSMGAMQSRERCGWYLLVAWCTYGHGKEKRE
jgi:hypothetical protein